MAAHNRQHIRESNGHSGVRRKPVTKNPAPPFAWGLQVVARGKTAAQQAALFNDARATKSSIRAWRSGNEAAPKWIMLALANLVHAWAEAHRQLCDDAIEYANNIRWPRNRPGELVGEDKKEEGPIPRALPFWNDERQS